MEAALEQVALHCSTELDVYTQCVEANPQQWTVTCAEKKAELTACAAKQCVWRKAAS
jgi:hypothetical protein